MAAKFGPDEVILPAATSDPTGTAGSIYYNSSTGIMRIKRGSGWSDVNATAPEFTTSSGNIGTVYTTQTKSFTIVVSSSSTPTFSVTSGSLPTGLSLSTSGTNCVISGTLASNYHNDYQSGTSTFTITATSGGLSSSRSFTISTSSKYVGYRCTTANENGTLSDTAPDGHYFTRVDFSAYGTPNGSCGSFSIGSCNSSSSNNYDPTPTQSYSTSASNGTWGDPCGGVGKRMYIQMSYGPNI